MNQDRPQQIMAMDDTVNGRDALDRLNEEARQFLLQDDDEPLILERIMEEHEAAVATVDRSLAELREAARARAVQQQIAAGLPEEEMPMVGEDPCGVCYVARASWRLHCGHHFCLPCTAQFPYVAGNDRRRAQLGKCPYCRSEITGQSRVLAPM